MTNEIPQSTALAEAKADSLGEYMNADPMGFGRVERDKLVAFLRAQRKGWEAVENAGGHKRAAKGTKSKTKPTVGEGTVEI